MSDKDRDRSGDGAGPVAKILPHSIGDRNCIRIPVGCRLLLFCLLLITSQISFSQGIGGSTLRGLSLLVDVGVLRPDNSHADFYNGNPSNANTLARILYSETYGNQIWNNLTEQDLIGSAVGNYNQITVAEYGEMSYRMAIQLGVGLRYDLEPRSGKGTGHWAWQMRFDYAKLNAMGQVLLNSGKNQTILSNQNAYVNCPASGLEERIFINLGLIRKFKLDNGLDFELMFGGNVNNTKVESSDIRIAGVTYSILDIWGGQSPSSYTGSYEYVNQGGIGYGAFASATIGFTLPVGTAISLGYTLYYNKVNLQGYDSFAFHHAVGINVYLNNFDFIN